MNSKYLCKIKEKLCNGSSYFMFWKLIIISFITISVYNFVNEINDKIYADTKYIEKRINDQIEGVREILTDSYDSIIELINQNKSSQDISDYLKSIEPNNGSDVYISTFILTNTDLTFKTSGQFSTDDRIDKYNKELKGRQYIIDTLSDLRNIKIGNIVNGIKSKKLSIPVGMGLSYENKYIGTILTGIDIDRLIKNIKTYNNVIDIKFDQYTRISSSELSKFDFILDVLLLKKPHIDVVINIPNIKEAIIISYPRDMFITQIQNFILSYISITTLIIIGLYYTKSMMRREFIDPINKFNRIIDSENYLCKDVTKTKKYEMIDFNNIKKFWYNTDLLISKFDACKEAYGQANSTIKFLAKEKIKDIENSDKFGCELFRNIEIVKNLIKKNSTNAVEVDVPIERLIFSIKNFYKNLDKPNDRLLYNLYSKLDEACEFLETSESGFVSKSELMTKFEKLDKALLEFYYNKNDGSPYIINSNYFKELEELEEHDIKQTIISIVEDNNLIKNNILCDVTELKVDKFSIYPKAFRTCFNYAINTLLSITKNMKYSNIVIDLFSVGNPNNSMLCINFRIGDKTNTSNDLNKIMLYGCKLFATFNSGNVRYDKNLKSLTITYPFVNLV